MLMFQQNSSKNREHKRFSASKKTSKRKKSELIFDIDSRKIFFSRRDRKQSENEKNARKWLLKLGEFQSEIADDETSSLCATFEEAKLVSMKIVRIKR
jgi:hypothetical protein